MRLVLVTLLLLQAAPAQSEADKLEAALRKFGNRTYKILLKGEPVGTYALKTRVAEEEGQKLAFLEDRLETKIGETVRTTDYTEKAVLKGLALHWTTQTDTALEGKSVPVIAIKDGDGHVSTTAGKRMHLKAVAGALGERALFRLVCMKEQKIGATLKVNALVLEPIDYQMDREVKCVAKETLSIGGRKIAAFKWEDKRDGSSILTGKPVPVPIDNAYWVGPDGALVKFKIGPLEMVPEAK